MSDAILNSITAMLVALGSPIKSTEDRKLERGAAGQQTIELVTAHELYQTCEVGRLPTAYVLTPPARGGLDFRVVQAYPSYRAENSHAHCNARRAPGLGVMYSAPAGFEGRDDFVFLVVLSSGKAYRYSTTITVWPGAPASE